MRLVVADGDQLVEAVAHRRRQPLRHALRQQGAGLVPGRPHRTAQHRVGRRENVFVADPAPRPRQQGRRAVEPQRFVFEEPRQPFAGGGVERAQTQVLTDALLMLGDRLLPALVGVDRLGVGPQLQGREPQDLPVDFQGRLLGEPPEHTHEGDLVREAQPIVGAPPQGDLSSVGLEEGGIADQAGDGRRRGRRPAQLCQEQTPVLAEQFSSIDEFIEATASWQASEKRRLRVELTSGPPARPTAWSSANFLLLGRTLGQIVTVLDAPCLGRRRLRGRSRRTSGSRADALALSVYFRTNLVGTLYPWIPPEIGRPDGRNHTGEGSGVSRGRGRSTSKLAGDQGGGEMTRSTARRGARARLGSVWPLC